MVFEICCVPDMLQHRFIPMVRGTLVRHIRTLMLGEFHRWMH